MCAESRREESIKLNTTQMFFLVPEDRTQWPAWRKALGEWRDRARKEMNYDGRIYELLEFAWTQRMFVWDHVMLWDRRFVDREAGRFRVERLLDYGEKQFGGYDILILWPDYPRIGIDDRNQFDHYRTAVGGMDAFKKMVEICHDRGVKAFIAFKPWDTETRREDESEVDANVRLVKELEIDGLFLDTMWEAREDHRRKLDAARPGVAFGPESNQDLVVVAGNHLSLHQGAIGRNRDIGTVPAILRNKWFERRHQSFGGVENDSTLGVQQAWMNGSGLFAWDNAFMHKVLWTERACSIMRSMLPIQRRYWRLFTGEGWTPMVDTLDDDVYACLWEGDGMRLWTVANTAEKEISGPVLRVDAAGDGKWFDLIRGCETDISVEGTLVELRAQMRRRGIAAFLCAPEDALGDDFQEFLKRQAAIDGRADFDTTIVSLVTELKPVEATKPYAENEIPEGMVSIPAADIVLRKIVRDWPPNRGRRLQTVESSVSLGAYAMDLTAVTNAQYAAFVKETGYRPKVDMNFLAHWPDGECPEELADHPVVYVDLDDARAYATWAGKRLPTESEWQHAAQGPDELAYPWGPEFDPEKCNADREKGTNPVTAYPDGRSPFGCYDMCGNVWELTESEQHDEYTHWVMLKGGSYFNTAMKPEGGSNWYPDGGPQPNAFSSKYILFVQALDRSPTIGFRCVVDVSESD